MKYKWNNRGFTLVEVMMCIVVLAIAMLSIMSYLLTSSQVTTRGRRIQHATLAAQSFMETYRSYGLNNILNSSIDPSGVSPSVVTINAPNKLPVYELSLFANSEGELFYQGNENQKAYEVDVVVDPNILVNTTSSAIPREFQINTGKDKVLSSTIVNEDVAEEIKVKCLASLSDADMALLPGKNAISSFRFNTFERNYLFHVSRAGGLFVVQSSVEYKIDFSVGTNVSNRKCEYVTLLTTDRYAVEPSIYLYNHLYDSVPEIAQLSAGLIKQDVSVTLDGGIDKDKLKLYVITPIEFVSGSTIVAPGSSNLVAEKAAIDSKFYIPTTVSSPVKVVYSYKLDGASGYVEDFSGFTESETSNTYYSVQIKVTHRKTREQLANISNTMQ